MKKLKSSCFTISILLAVLAAVSVALQGLSLAIRLIPTSLTLLISLLLLLSKPWKRQESEPNTTEKMYDDNYVIHSAVDKLLTQDRRDKARFIQILDSIGFSFLSDWFQVCVIDICYSDIAEYADFDSKMDITITERVSRLSEMLEDYLPDDCRHYAVVKEEKMVCLVNWNCAEDLQSLNRWEDLLLEYVQEISATEGIRVRIAMSKLTQGTDNIWHAYEEAKQLQEMSIFYPATISLVTEKNKRALAMTSDEKHRILAQDKRLINLAFDKQYKEAAKVVESIIEVFCNTPNTLYSLKPAIHNRMQWVVNVSAMPPEIVTILNQEISGIQIAKTIPVMRQHCREIFDILEKNKNIDFQTATIRMETILQYINENRRSPDLNVSTVSYQFNLNTSYISHIFKKQVGIGMAEYINKARVADAKDLLRNTNCSVNEIAQTVGFGSSSTMIRSFKRLEGVTPAVYRLRADK